jgi:N-dimethylarginine dimethylaminohydrolase
MCPPHHFGVSYVINPWMQGNAGQVDPALASRQWDALYATLRQFANVHLLDSVPGLPDMVFTANAGVVLDGQVIPAHFHHAEREGEEPYFESWFRAHGFEIVALPGNFAFEGAGDALYDHARGCLWMAYGKRTRAAASVLLHQALTIETVPLRLVDPYYYHLDTCFCPLDGGWLLWYPPAFDPAARSEIERRIPAVRRIAVTDEDARDFACNAICLAGNVLLNRASPGLQRSLRLAGNRVIELPLGEFIKAGGAAKCLTLRLDESHVDSPAFARAA